MGIKMHSNIKTLRDFSFFLSCFVFLWVFKMALCTYCLIVPCLADASWEIYRGRDADPRGTWGISQSLCGLYWKKVTSPTQHQPNAQLQKGPTGTNLVYTFHNTRKIQSAYCDSIPTNLTKVLQFSNEI